MNTRGAAAELSPRFCDVAVTALRRCHDTWASVSRVCVTRMPGLPAGWLLCFRYGFGVYGIWWGLTISLAVIATSLFFFWSRTSAKAFALRQS